MYKNVFLGIDLFLRFTAYIGPLLTILRIPEGDVIYNEGDYASEIYFIREGSIALCIKECDYHPFFTIDAGQYFGEIELIKKTQWKYTVIAQQSELLGLSKSHFFKIFISEFREIGEELHEDARMKKKIMKINIRKLKLISKDQNKKLNNNQSKPIINQNLTRFRKIQIKFNILSINQNRIFRENNKRC